LFDTPEKAGLVRKERMVRLEFLNAIDLHLKIQVYWVAFEVVRHNHSGGDFTQRLGFAKAEPATVEPPALF